MSAKKLKLAREAARRTAARADEEAVQIWNGLSVEKREDLARETVQTREKELRLAFPDVIGVGYGLKARRNVAGQFTDEVCVTFIVRNKWAETPLRPRKRAIPQYLYAYCTIEAERRRCAIPTDVNDSERYRGVKPQNNEKILATSPGYPWCEGVFCCAVRYPGKPQIYGIGCHHVLAMSEIIPEVPPTVEVVRGSNQQQVLGHLGDYHGIVGPGREFFDAAAIEMAEEVVRAQVINQPPPGILVVPRASGLPGGEARYVIKTPRGNNILATRTGVLSGPIVEYEVLENYHGGELSAKVLIELKTQGDFTQTGDSGSPVFDEAESTFMGMHIAGIGNRAFFIPAWELLQASNYYFTTGQTKFELV